MKIAAALFTIFAINAFSDDIFAQEVSYDRGDFIAIEKPARHRDEPAIVMIEKIVRVQRNADGTAAVYLVAEDSAQYSALLTPNEIKAKRGQMIARDLLPTFIREVPQTKIVELTKASADFEFLSLSTGDKMLLQIFDSAQSRRNYPSSRMAKSIALNLYNRAKEIKNAQLGILERMLENSPGVQKMLKLNKGLETKSLSRSAVESAEGAR